MRHRSRKACYLVLKQNTFQMIQNFVRKDFLIDLITGQVGKQLPFSQQLLQTSVSNCLIYQPCQPVPLVILV